MDITPVVQTPNLWLFWLLAMGTLSLGLLKTTYPQQFKVLLQSPFRASQSGKFQIKFDVFNTTLEVWAIIAIALGLVLIQQRIDAFGDWVVLARYALLIAIFLTFQGTIYQLAGYVFIDQMAYGNAWQEKGRFLRWAAVWMTPIIWWLSFAGEPRQAVAWVGAGILIILYLWSLARLVVVLFKHSHLRVYHNVLYLCTLEIAPLVLFLLLV